jgi:hypothetical protein
LLSHAAIVTVTVAAFFSARVSRPIDIRPNMSFAD